MVSSNSTYDVPTECLIWLICYQSLEHFQNTEHGKEANMGSCFVKQDFPLDKQTKIQSSKGAEKP